MPHAAGPLEGIRVLELGSFIAGPFAGQLLGDYGADVIKVEPPEDGDPMRTWGVTADGHGLWWPTIGRNKRSVTADLRDDAGRQLVRRIAAEADVVLENFRPGRLADWGLDYDSVRATNPGVVMVHVSGFGQTGPRATEAGFGSIGEAVGGIRHTTGDPDRAPARVWHQPRRLAGRAVRGDRHAGGAAGAPHERGGPGGRRRHLRGRRRAHGVLAGRPRRRWRAARPLGRHPAGGGARQRLPDRRRLRGAHRRATPTRCSVACAPPWATPTLAADERFATHTARGAHAAELDALVGRWTATLPADALLACLADHSVPAGRVYTAADMLTDPHYLAREMVQRATARAGFDLPMTGVVPRFSRTPGTIRDVGPALGEHTAEVEAELA